MIVLCQNMQRGLFSIQADTEHSTCLYAVVMLTHQELATRRKRHCYELKSHEHRCSKAQYGKTRLIYIIVYAFTSVSYHSRKQFYLYSQTLLFVKHTSKISLRCIRISLVRVCIRLLNSRLLHICCLLERVQLPSLSALP